MHRVNGVSPWTLCKCTYRFLSGDFTEAEGCGRGGRLEGIPDAHTDVTTHSVSVMEAGGVTLVSEVLKVTHQVLAV